MSKQTIGSTHYSRVYDNFLAHYKYIKREKIAGAKKGENKWRYWYKNDTTDTKKNAIDVSNLIDNAKETIANAYGWDEYHEYADSLSDTSAKYEIAYNASTKYHTAKRYYDVYKQAASENSLYENAAKAYKDQMDAAYDEYEKALSDYSTAIKNSRLLKTAYENTMLYSVSKLDWEKDDILANGKSVVEKVLNDVDTIFGNQNDDVMLELPLKTDLFTSDEDMVAINENYDPSNPDTSRNCQYCTYAYDMRKRGYDVEAIEAESDVTISMSLDFYEWTPTHIAQDRDEWVEERIVNVYRIPEEWSWDYAVNDNATSDVTKATKRLNDELSSYGEGARGNLVMNWLTGSAHSIVWEVENGKVVYRDCQINKICDAEDILSRSRSVSYIRLDDLTPNKNMLKTVKASD